jgi:hypothetical protein
MREICSIIYHLIFNYYKSTLKSYNYPKNMEKVDDEVKTPSVASTLVVK